MPHLLCILKAKDTSIPGSKRSAVLDYVCTIIQVNANGVLSFGNTFSSASPEDFPFVSALPLIAPFWADFSTQTSQRGDILYRICNNASELAQAGTFISDQFAISFTPTSLFIATWDQVPRSIAPLEVSTYYVCGDNYHKRWSEEHTYKS